MSEFSRFIPIAKVDPDQRMVYGRATDETLDVDHEVVDYEATKKAVADWSQWRNIREMHGPSAVGVAEEITLDDTQKTLDLGVKVVDDQAWEKVKAGVYKGFSIGGRKRQAVVEKAADGANTTRITDYLMTEISLVDRPANPAATFSLVKRDFQPGEGDGPPPREGASDAPPKDRMPGDMPPGEGESEPPELTVDDVKSIVIDILKQLGLVREGGGNPFAQAAQVNDLQKSIGSQLTELAKVADLQKVSGDLTKAVQDLAKIVQAVDQIDDRLEAIEKMPAGSGPVLREVGMLGVNSIDSQAESVLKAVMNDTTDPQVRQLIGQKLAEMQIKAVHQTGGQNI